jgi:predicted ArsR family transcriptional regulator
MSPKCNLTAKDMLDLTPLKKTMISLIPLLNLLTTETKQKDLPNLLYISQRQAVRYLQLLEENGYIQLSKIERQQKGSKGAPYNFWCLTQKGYDLKNLLEEYKGVKQ